MSAVLFYTPSCGHCHRILELLDEQPSINIKRINVSETKTPVNAVPTIVTPDNKTLVGAEAFEYVNSLSSSSISFKQAILILLVLSGVVYCVYSNRRQE